MFLLAGFYCIRRSNHFAIYFLEPTLSFSVYLVNYLFIYLLVVFFFQGQKGERGLPGKSLQGAIKFSDTAENCSLHTAGTVRYNTSQKTLQLCNGHTWLPLVTAWKGHVASNPGRHCLDILNSGEL